MPPKKSAGPTAPVRRSARLASREPSAEPAAPAPAAQPTFRLLSRASTAARRALSFDLEGTIAQVLAVGTPYRHAIMQRLTESQRADVLDGVIHEHEGRIEELEAENRRLEARVASKERRDWKLKAIYDGYHAQQQAEEKQQQPAPSSPAAPPSPPSLPVAAPSPPSLPLAPSSPIPAASTAVVPVQPATTPAPSSFARRLVGWVASPFTRKRAADDEQQPSQKRARVEEQPITKEAHVEESHQDEDMSEAPQQKQPRAPPSQHTPHSVGPSAKNPFVPTSLSTVTEYTENSNLLSSINTPSRPSRAPSQRGFQAPHNTPSAMASHQAQGSNNDQTPHRVQASQDPDQTPRNKTPATSHLTRQANPHASNSLPQSTPAYTMRRSHQLRTARFAKENTSKTPRSYAWEKNNSTPQRPKERNADARLAKLQRMRELQKELRELSQDIDIQEIESHSIHRRKRVKIDELAIIPHNRPGDSASTFRVPDVDSDDEMSVEDTSEDTNMFDEAEKVAAATRVEQVEQATPQPPPQLTSQAPKSSTFQFPSATPQAASTPAPSTSTPFSLPSAPAPSQPAPPKQTTVKEPVFNFPNVGLKPAGYSVTPEYRAGVAASFASGFSQWIAARQQ